MDYKFTPVDSKLGVSPKEPHMTVRIDTFQFTINNGAMLELQQIFGKAIYDIQVHTSECGTAIAFTPKDPFNNKSMPQKSVSSRGLYEYLKTQFNTSVFSRKLRLTRVGDMLVCDLTQPPLK